MLKPEAAAPTMPSMREQEQISWFESLGPPPLPIPVTDTDGHGRYVPPGFRQPGLKGKWGGIGAGTITVGAILLKFKAFLIPLLKFFPIVLKTGGTMILSVFAYAMIWGWRFALGFVVILFVHESGHLLAARMAGIRAGWPVFIPFAGAFIALKDAPKNAWLEAIVGYGGPFIGTLGGLICVALAFAFSSPLLMVLAFASFWLNLFNLIPISPLDGGRIVTAISPWLWVVGIVLIIPVLFISQMNLFLLLILVISLPRVFLLFRKRTDTERRYFEISPAQRIIMAVLYFGLVLFLAVAMAVTQLIIGIWTQNG